MYGYDLRKAQDHSIDGLVQCPYRIYCLTRRPVDLVASLTPEAIVGHDFKVSPGADLNTLVPSKRLAKHTSQPNLTLI